MTSRIVSRILTLSVLGALTLTVGWLVLASAAVPENNKTGPRFSGPYTHDNLTVFLIHGPDQLKRKNYLTLAEAFEKKLFVIHETQGVNQLSAENLSPDMDVLILSGDILKGGQQDRIAQHDEFIAPKSGKVPLKVFCVELTAPRWMARLDSSNKDFKASPGNTASNSLRLATRKEMSQGGVWKEVAEVQKRLRMNVGAEVKAKESESSLALSLQAKEVRAATEAYLKRLASITADKKDAIGYAFAINGKVVMVDIYGSAELFGKVWPRLIQATATEAVAEQQKGKKFEPVTIEAVRGFIDEADRGKQSATDIGGDVRQITNDAARNVRFESRQKDKALIRSNYLAY